MGGLSHSIFLLYEHKVAYLMSNANVLASCIISRVTQITQFHPARWGNSGAGRLNDADHGRHTIPPAAVGPEYSLVSLTS